MRNSTVSLRSSSGVSKNHPQVTYMTRSKRGRSSCKNSCGEEFNNKKISSRRGNHSSEGLRTEINAKSKLNNHCQDRKMVNQCIPSLPSKKLSKLPPRISRGAHPAVSDQSVQKIKVENNAVLEEHSVRTQSKKEQNSKKNSHVCTFCHKEFNSRTKLQRHATRHDPNKPYGCEICGKFFDDARFVKTHRTLHEKKSHKECDICGKVFNERIFFDIHRLTHFEQKPFRCDICEDIFKDRTTFMRHRNNHKARVRKVAERFLSMKEVLKQKLETANDFKPESIW